MSNQPLLPRFKTTFAIGLLCLSHALTNDRSWDVYNTTQGGLWTVLPEKNCQMSIKVAQK